MSQMLSVTQVKKYKEEKRKSIFDLEHKLTCFCMQYPILVHNVVC